MDGANGFALLVRECLVIRVQGFLRNTYRKDVIVEDETGA